MPLFTLGHSNRGFSEFLHILKVYGIEVLVDIRAFPTSRRFPHFDRERLAESLPAEGIEYHWLGKELGGYRKEGLGEASPNKAWRSQGFRNYADHMLTPEFRQGVAQILHWQKKKKVALMCAERMWWRCHRRLLADWLVAHGYPVIHILDLGHTEEHVLPEFARTVEGQLIYPAGDLWSPGCEKDYSRKNSRTERPVA